jgi:hypothetical protein
MDKDPLIDELFLRCETKGDINYCITKLIHLWVLKRMRLVKSLVKKYDILNDAYGILRCAASEFYAAVVRPYEKLKTKEDGFISQLDEFADGAIPEKTNINKCKNCGLEFYHKPLICPNCKTHLP